MKLRMMPERKWKLIVYSQDRDKGNREMSAKGSIFVAKLRSREKLKVRRK